MADRSNKQSDMPVLAPALTAALRLTPQLLIMFRVLLSSPQRTKLLLLGVAIVAVIGTTQPLDRSRLTHGINRSTMRSRART
jgi:hypothetical protein